MNRLACWTAICAIRLYQALGRWLVRRRCLFTPSCSARSIAFFRAGSFLDAWQRTRRQLARCSGSFSLRTNSRREVEMILGTGEVVLENELAPWVIRKLKRFSPPPAKE